MLRTLSIRNLAVVESLDLEFSAGLTVLTGETGAGKSILLTALGLTLGDRADPDYIRPGSQQAEIILEFDTGDAMTAEQWLQNQDLAEEDSGVCLIRRLIRRDGRSKAYINDRPVTLKNLQQLASRLVEIHGQHAHLNLLAPQEQRRLLDTAAQNAALLNTVKQHYQTWHSLREQIEQQARLAQAQTARRELLNYQLEELRQADIESLSYPALNEEHTLHANLDKIISTGQTELEHLYESERDSVYQTLGHSIDALTEIAQLAPELQTLPALLNEALIQIQECGQQLRRSLDALETDPQRLIWLEAQLASIHSLARKHQVEPKSLQTHYQRLKTELDKLEHVTENTDALKQQLARTVEQYQTHAQKLSRKRQKQAQALQTQVTHIIQQLSMPQGQFSIALQALDDATPRPHGLDQILFQVSANPGMPQRALDKIASGGELSRIGLAIQVAISANGSVPSMIFDEVDTGIGGGVAEIVGQRLRDLGVHRQVLCVTHLPQVAAQGHHHLLVEKASQADATRTRVRHLSDEERIREIARMLGGVTITAQTLAHAREMLGMA